MDTTAPSSQEKKSPPTLLERVFITRNYAINWVGLTFSRLGTSLYATSLLLWVGTTLTRNAPWAAFAFGGVVLVQTIVFFVTSIFAGVYVDRWDARRTQLFTDAARTILFALFIFATGVVPLPFPAASDAANLFQIACVYLALILSGICEPFSATALNVLLYDLVKPADIERTFTRGQVLTNIARILGPPLGAVIFFSLGIQWAIFLNALSYLISFIAFFLIRIPSKKNATSADQKEGEAQQKANFLREFLEGVRFIFGNRLLVAIFIAITLVTAGVAGIGVFNLYFVTDNLHAPPAVFAYLDVMIGVGTLAGAVFMVSWLRKRLGLVKAYWICVLANGLLFFIFARLTNVVAAFIVLFLVGAAQSVSTVGFGTILYRATPRGMMGRVNALLGQILTIAAVLGIAVVPFLITVPLRNKFTMVANMLFGPIDTVYMAVAIMIITSGLYLWISLNDYAQILDKPPDEESQESLTELQPQPKESRLSTRQKRISILALGLVATVLIFLPVALATPTNQISSFQLSHGHPASGQPVDGMSCQSSLGSVQHANVRLTVYVNGQQTGIPVGVGSVAPVQPGVAALASHGKLTCLYPLHIFEADNIIHVDAQTNHTYTLGNFFDVWGQPLSRVQVTDYVSDPNHALTFYVFDPSGNGQTYTGDPRAIPLIEHETIVVAYNSPHVQFTPYNAWNGL